MSRSHDPGAQPARKLFAITPSDGADTITIAAAGGGGGGGDASTDTSTSVDGEIVLFSGTGGKTLKRATGSGLAKIASGVLSATTSPTDIPDHTHADADNCGVLGIAAFGLTDPNADRIPFWDDSAGALVWLAAGTNLTITGTTIAASGGGAGGDPIAFPWIAGGGYYDASSAIPSSWAATAMLANRLYATPFYVPNAITVSDIGTWVTTGVTSALLRFGIYALGADNKPGALLWESPSAVAAATSGAAAAHTGLSLNIDAGWYYAAAVSDSAISIHFATNHTVAPRGYAALNATLTKQGGYFKAHTFGALPNPFGATGGNVDALIRLAMLVSALR